MFVRKHPAIGKFSSRERCRERRIWRANDTRVERRVQLPSNGRSGAGEEGGGNRAGKKGWRKVNRRVPVVSIDIPPAGLFRESVFAPPSGPAGPRRRAAGTPRPRHASGARRLAFFAESHRAAHYTRNNSETNSRPGEAPIERVRKGWRGRGRERETDYFTRGNGHELSRFSTGGIRLGLHDLCFAPQFSKFLRLAEFSLKLSDFRIRTDPQLGALKILNYPKILYLFALKWTLLIIQISLLFDPSLLGKISERRKNPGTLSPIGDSRFCGHDRG